MRNLYSGRTNLKTWIREVVLYSFTLVIVWLFLASFLESDHISATVYWLAVLLLLVVAGVMISASSVRRFHDKGESGWYALYLLMPLINLVVLKDLFAPGQTGSNQYGEPISKQARQSSNGRQSVGRQIANGIAVVIFFMVLASIATVALALLFNSEGKPLPLIVIGLIGYATLRFWRWLSNSKS